MAKETTVKKYDILVVGAGLYGATCARLLTEKGYKCLVVEKNNYVGGMCATKKMHGIDVHINGPHIFHTNDQAVWEFVNKYSQFNSYEHVETILSNGRMWTLPIDTKAYNMMFGSLTAINAYNELSKEIKNYNVKKPSSLEDSLVLQYGVSLYTEVFKPYYEKKFGMPCGSLAASMPDMQPSYYKLTTKMHDTKMQGIPMNGYTALVENIIGDDIPIMLNKDFVNDFAKMQDLAEVIIYTGPVDRLCKYVHGPLKWSSLEVKTVDESMRGTHIYGNAVTKVADKANPMLRITEHKWFTPEREDDENWSKKNIVSYEQHKEWKVDEDPFYSINDTESTELYKKYVEFINEKWPNIVLGGTKGMYVNMRMDETIKAAMETCSAASLNN